MPAPEVAGLASPMLRTPTRFCAARRSMPPTLKTLPPETWVVAVLSTFDPATAASALPSVWDARPGGDIFESTADRALKVASVTDVTLELFTLTAAAEVALRPTMKVPG